MDWPTVAVWFFAAVVGGSAGAYVKEYFGAKGKTRAAYEDSETLRAIQRLEAYEQEKGKQMATSEDIEKVLAQVKAVTNETETIKAQIGGDLGRQQTLWSLRKECIFKMFDDLETVRSGFIDLSSQQKNNRLSEETILKVRSSITSLVTEAQKLMMLLNQSMGGRLKECLKQVSGIRAEDPDDALGKIVQFNTGLIGLCTELFQPSQHR